MKPNKMRKLMLNKKTVANLGISQMHRARGGAETDIDCLPSVVCSTKFCPSLDDGQSCPFPLDDTNPPWCGASEKPTDCVSGGHTDCDC